MRIENPEIAHTVSELVGHALIAIAALAAKTQDAQEKNSLERIAMEVKKIGIELLGSQGMKKLSYHLMFVLAQIYSSEKEDDLIKKVEDILKGAKSSPSSPGPQQRTKETP